MENIYKEGEVVFDRTRPTQKLIVRRVVGNIYYCVDLVNPLRKLLVFLERDLQSGKKNFENI